MMNTKIKSGILIPIIAGLFLISGCKKYLEEKSDKKLVLPNTLSDLQALLDNYGNVNSSSSPSPSAEVSATDYYLTDADWTSLSYESDRRMYTWQKDYVFNTGDIGNDWSAYYYAIYYSNTVLEQIAKIDRNTQNQTNWDNIKGQALLLRANRFLDVAAIHSLAYDGSTASTDLGIVLRTTTDFNEKSVRANVQQTYSQIIQDLKQSVPLLPAAPISSVRASRPAAYALLARTYLYMRDYKNAGLFADSCLQLYSKIVDYNTLDTTAQYPLTALNSEVIFARGAANGEPLYNGTAKIDLQIYRSYNSNDLRKSVFFIDNGDGTFGFRGFYTGEMSLFTGVGCDEVYLTRAECSARQGQLSAAMDDLNILLVNRYKIGTFTSLSITNAQDALQLILTERRKELLMRGLRWMDIKRLNKEGANIILTRTVSGQSFTLPPNDLRYALPIPDDVIASSGMKQNLR